MAVPALLMALALGSGQTDALPGLEPLPAERLGELRGGFDLPGGGSITLGVVTTTRVDGHEVLQTVFNLETGAPTITVLGRTGDGSGVSAVTPGSVGINTLDGRLTVSTIRNGVRVELAGNGLDVSHLLGGAFGSVVANTADNRAIDVSTTLDISMSGVARDAIGASRAGIDTLALDATSRLIR